MEATGLIDLIPTLGFPIVCVIGLAIFIVWMYKDNDKKNTQREDKLYNEIKENREVNAKAIQTIALYAERLDNIQHDIKDIKTDVGVLKSKVE